jgi:hypothetical protein
MDDANPPQPTELVDDFVAQRTALVRRLDDGYVRIEQAIVTGEDVQAWEEFWISLLADYESLSDQLRAA